jgi:hypothetical protein
MILFFLILLIRKSNYTKQCCRKVISSMLCQSQQSRKSNCSKRCSARGIRHRLNVLYVIVPRSLSQSTLARLDRGRWSVVWHQDALYHWTYPNVSRCILVARLAVQALGNLLCESPLRARTLIEIVGIAGVDLIRPECHGLWS